MKTRKKMITGILGLCILALSFTACDKENELLLKDQPVAEKPAFFNTTVMDVQVPSTIFVNQPAEIFVKFIKPNPCYEFNNIQLSSNGFELDLNVFLEKPDPEVFCIQIIGEGEQTLITTFSQPGLYTLTYSGSDGPESIEFTVLLPKRQ